MFDAGIVVAGGSDHMIRFDARLATNPYHPFLGMWIAITRKMVDGNVMDPEQRVTRMEALKMWTWNGAYLMFDEKNRGLDRAGQAGRPGGDHGRFPDVPGGQDQGHRSADDRGGRQGRVRRCARQHCLTDAHVTSSWRGHVSARRAHLALWWAEAPVETLRAVSAPLRPNFHDFRILRLPGALLRPATPAARAKLHVPVATISKQPYFPRRPPWPRIRCRRSIRPAACGR